MMPAEPRSSERLTWTRQALEDESVTLEPASADASFRSYWRTHYRGRSWIVMDSPPALEDPHPWLAVGAQLAAAGLHVPEVIATDLERGFLLIEDLGATLYLDALTGTSADALYGDAMNALLRIESGVDAAVLEPYDATFLSRELELLPAWFLHRHLGMTLSADERATLDRSFALLVASAVEQPQVFVHRDFHSRNLLVVAADNPGIIDFQGALRGPLTYDLASLLRDCYIAWDDERVYGWVDGQRQRLCQAGLLDAGVDAERFRRWFDLMALQRHLKVLGLFCRLAWRDGKRAYLGDLPQVWRYVREATDRTPQLQALGELLQRTVGERDLTQECKPCGTR